MKYLSDKRLWIILALIGVVLGLRLAGLGDLLSIETLRAHRAVLAAYVDERAVLSATLFVLAYTAAVGVSLPGATVLTLAGGFLFGPFLGTVLNVTGATLGAALIFIFARRLFGDDVLKKFGQTAVKLGENIRSNAWSYLLVLRLAPLFPFFLVNLVPAFVGVSLPVFVLTTFFGIIPATAVFSTAGAGLGAVLDNDGAFSIGSVLTPEILAGLFGLAALSLAAIPLKKRFGK